MKPATVEAMAFRGESAAEMLDISMISPWANNPRRTIDPERLRELADSIGKVGVLQPILVRPDNARFLIVSGERRWRAARQAGLKQIPAVVRTLTDAEALELAVTENLQREDERQTWGQDGPERLHKSIAESYRTEWERQCEQRKKDGDFFPLPRPIVSIISRDEYLRARFGARK